jgi:WD40 repeat protein
MSATAKPARELLSARLAYAAFVSYSHSADVDLAQALQRGLHRFARRPFQLRAVHVFRDSENLAASPALWPAIERALTESEFLILMASPQSASSTWVGKELDCWCRNKPAQKILIALTGGDIFWDEPANDFDWARTTALPRRLSRIFEAEPLWVDLRWAHQSQVSLAHPRFRDCIADLAAPLHGRAKDELIGDDLRQTRRTRRLATATILVLASMVLALAWMSVEVERRRRTVIQERDRALTSESHYLANAALGQVAAGKPELGALLAIEALPTPQHDRPYVPEAEAALNTSLGALGPTKILDLAEGSLQVSSARFSPDGKRLVTVASENTAQIWDTATGKQVAILKGHQAPLWLADYVPDGSRIVTTSADGTARLWDATTGEQVRIFQGHRGPVLDAAISPDGRLLATASADSTAKLWRMETGAELVTLRGHTQSLCCIRISPDGSRIITASTDATARLWDVQTGKQLAIFKHTPQGMSAIAGQSVVIRFSPDGQVVASAHDNNAIRLWHSLDGSPAAVLETATGEIQDAAFSSDGSIFSVASSDGTTRVWQLRSRGRNIEPVSDPAVLKERKESDGSSENHSLAFSPADEFIATAGEDFLQLWDPLGSRELAALSLDAPANSIVTSRDGGHLAIIHFDHVSLWKVQGGSFTRWRHHMEREQIQSGDKGPVTNFSVHGPNFTWDDHRGWDPPVSLSNLANKAAVVTGRNIALLDAETGQIISRIAAHSRVISRAMFNAMGDRLLTTSYDGTAKIWDARNGVLQASLTGHQGPLLDGAFSPSGDLVATASEDRTVRLWDANGAPKSVLRGHPTAVRHLAFSKDGKRIITVGSDGSARVWDVVSGTQLSVLQIANGGIGVAVLDRSGDRAVTAGEGNNYILQLWDTATGKELHRWQNFAGTVLGLDFGPDGRTVLAWGADGAARLFETQDHYKRLAAVGSGCYGPGSIAQAWQSDDQARIITVLRNGRIDVWDTHKAVVLLTLHTFPDTHNTDAPCKVSTSEMRPDIVSAAVSPDLHNILINGENGAVVLFSIPSREEAIRRALQLVPRSLTLEEHRQFFLAE